MLLKTGGHVGRRCAGRAAGISWFNGQLYLAGADDLPGPAPLARPWSLLPDLEGPPVIAVHGYRYDPQARNRNNPHLGTFRTWREQLLKGRETLGFGWYSAPAGLGAVLRAWRHGRYNTYRWAWDLAEDAGRALAQVILGLNRPCEILCHSLGSRVVLGALRADNALPVTNVVFMNGAELARTACRTAVANRHVRFVNLVVREDDVLARFGSVFAPKGGLYASVIGHGGLGLQAPTNWIDVALDAPEVQIWGAEHGWALRGDNPDSAGDHWFTFRHEGNHGLIRAALAGEPLEPPQPGLRHAANHRALAKP